VATGHKGKAIYASCFNLLGKNKELEVPFTVADEGQVYVTRRFCFESMSEDGYDKENESFTNEI